jgi:hypothetical protein
VLKAGHKCSSPAEGGSDGILLVQAGISANKGLMTSKTTTFLKVGASPAFLIQSVLGAPQVER